MALPFQALSITAGRFDRRLMKLHPNRCSQWLILLPSPAAQTPFTLEGIINREAESLTADQSFIKVSSERQKAAFWLNLSIRESYDLTSMQDPER
jgi:hypothetical protein